MSHSLKAIRNTGEKTCEDQEKEEAIVWDPYEFELIERDEREARLRLEAAREEALMNEGEVSSQHHELLRTLEAEWKHALERLHEARQGAES